MAVRTISTKLAISGEAAYKSAISGINTELKTLQSALKLTKSEFAGQANSIDALKAKDASLHDIKAKLTQKIGELQKALENANGATSVYAQKKQELTAQIEKNNTALEKLRASADDTSKEEAELVEENKRLNTELADNERYLQSAQKGVNGWQTQLNNAKAQLGNLNLEIAKNDQYLQEAAGSADGCATSIDKFGKEVSNTIDPVDALAASLGTIGLMTALKNAADAMEACVTASIEFESAMAGVAKTTDLTQDELAAMGEDIKDLSTKIPLTTTELAKIAETAGQLGIANSALLEFTTVMAGLGVATNLTSEEAATMLAQFSAITGMDASFYENLGSTLVALGNNFATNEQRIADMSLAIAAAGNNAQMSEAEMMALSTAVTSVGIESATGGTQMSKLIMEMQRAVETGENLDAWAGAAGMSAAEFTQLWGKDAAAALTTFIGNLNNLDSSATVTLNTLGITETRMMQMITSLANAENQTGHLTSAIDTANMAWNENAALARETSLRYETTESKMTMLSNSVNNLGIAVGDKLTPATKRLADGGITVLDWLSDMVEESDALVPVTTAVLTGVVTLTAGLGVYVTVTKIATIATTLLGKSFLTFMATPAGIVIGVVALVASLAALAVTASDSATPSVKELTAATREMGEAFDDANATYEQNATATEAATAVVNRYITKLEELERSGLTSAESQREYHNTLALLCQVVPDLANYINLETDEIIGGTSALRANTEAWKANALAQAMQERVTAQYGAYADVLLEAERNSIELTRAQSDLDAIQQEHQSTIDHMNELYGEAEVKVTALSDEYGYMVDPMTQLDAEYFELEQSLQTYGDRMWEAQDRIDTYTEAVEDSEEYLSEYEEEIGLVEEAFDNLTSAQDSSTSSTEASNSAISGITTQIQQLALSYKEARDAAFDSINSQIGLFDSFAAEVSADTDTVEEMISRWAEQTANLASYTENLQKAAQYGLDEGLVQSLSDGSAESAGYLATIIQGVEDAGGSLEGMSGDAQTFVDSINTSFGENLQARNALSDEIAAAKIGLEEALSEIEEAAAAADFSGFADAVSSAFASVGVDADAAGINFSAGLSSGITEGTGAVTEAAGAAGQAAVDAANSAMGIASPSTVMYESGYNYGLGLANGITDSTALVTGAATLFGSSLNETMKQSSELSVTGFITKFAEIQTKTNAELTKLKTTVTTATASLVPQMNTIGVSLVDGLISGVNSRSGALAEAMASVVKSAISSARTAARSHSPSKATEEIAVDIDEGFIVGFEKQKKKVADSLQNVVDHSLDLDFTDSINRRLQAIRGFDAEDIERSAPTSTTNTTTVIIKPQNLSNEQLDYIFEKFNVRMGDETSA